MSRKSCLIRLFKTTVSCKLFTAIILSVFLGQPALTYAGVVIGGTRVVYLSNNADKFISVFSKEEKILKYDLFIVNGKRKNCGISALEEENFGTWCYKNKENIKYLTILWANAIILRSEEKESRVSTLTLARVSDYGLYEDNEAHSVFLCG